MNRDPNYHLRRANYFYKMASKNDSENENEPLDSDDYTLKLVKLNPKNNEKIIKTKPIHKRYYDPITKHYYKSETNDVPQTKDPEIWYPENKLSYKTIYDPKTGKYYRVDKIYDGDGNFSYQFNKLNYQACKKPGTNFYRPVYKINK